MAQIFIQSREAALAADSLADPRTALRDGFGMAYFEFDQGCSYLATSDEFPSCFSHLKSQNIQRANTYNVFGDLFYNCLGSREAALAADLITA